jgi:hypothetical protein
MSTALPSKRRTDDPTKPTFLRKEVVASQPTLVLTHRLLGGPAVMWEHSLEYVKKWKDEEDPVYLVRRKCEPLFEGLKRTVLAATGLLFAKPPQVTYNGNNAVMEALWNNLDGRGTRGDVFLAQFAAHAVPDGLGVFLIDHPPTPKDANGEPIRITLANEAQFNLRPMVARYTRGQVLSWRERVVNNVTTLAQVVFHEPTDVDADLYGTATQQRFRRVYLWPDSNGVFTARWQVLEERESQKGGELEYVEIAAGAFINRNGDAALALPVAIAYTGRKHATLHADFPLEGVAYANLTHWLYATDLRFGRMIAGVEQLVVSGNLHPDPTADATLPTQTQIKIGPLVAVYMQQGGTVQWVGPSGKGLEQLEKGCVEKIEQMDTMGLGFLVPNRVADRTATEAALENYAQKSTLATAAVGMSDACNVVGEWLAWYYGMDKTQAMTIQINTDFDSTRMDANVMNAYATLVKSGFPKLVVLRALQDGGRIPEDADLEELALAWDTELEAQRQMELLRLQTQSSPAGPEDGTPPNPDGVDAGNNSQGVAT